MKDVDNINSRLVYVRKKYGQMFKQDRLHLMSIAMYSASIQFATTVKQRSKRERASLCTFLKFKETVFLESENRYN